jgi:hypothetical protein
MTIAYTSNTTALKACGGVYGDGRIKMEDITLPGVNDTALAMVANTLVFGL